MKPNDLWEDSLGDALPPGLAETTLATMQRERRRMKMRRRVVGASAALLALALGIFALHSPRESTPIAPIATASPQPAAPAITIHQLTDEELLARFSNVGVALAGPPEDRQLLIVLADGEVLRP